VGVGAVPLGHGHDGINLRMGQGPGVDTLYPGAERAAKPQFLGLAHQPGGIGVNDEPVVQINRLKTRRQDRLHRDGGGEPHQIAFSAGFHEHPV